MNLVRKITILVTLQITLIIASFLSIAYLESQTNLTGNMVNVAGKNRLLASIVQIELNRVLFHDQVQNGRVSDALDSLEENIHFLKDGGRLSGIEIPILPPIFNEDWKRVADEFQHYEDTVLALLESQEGVSLDRIGSAENADARLIALSDNLTEKMGRYVEVLSVQLILLQIVLGIVNVAIHVFMITFIWRIFRAHTEQEKRVEKFATIGEFAAMMAHDMRNPLGTIRNSMTLIQSCDVPQPVHSEIRRINRSIKRMSHQIEGVLNYVRIVPLVVESKPIQEILEHSLEVIAIPENIRLSFPEGNDLMIQCDAEKIEFVFSNLLLNAVQAIGSSPGHISVRLQKREYEDKIIIVEFENSGSKIPKKDIHRVFDPLFTTKMQGTGLGLTSCKNIIERHSGTISVKSNRGLVTFTVCIPRTQG